MQVWSWFRNGVYFVLRDLHAKALWVVFCTSILFSCQHSNVNLSRTQVMGVQSVSSSVRLAEWSLQRCVWSLLTLPHLGLWWPSCISSDISIDTPRARTSSTSSSSGNKYSSVTSRYLNPQNYNTIGHNRKQRGPSATRERTSSTSSNNGSDFGPMNRSVSASDISGASSSQRTPRPRPTLLSAARMANGSYNSLRKNTAAKFFSATVSIT